MKRKILFFTIMSYLMFYFPHAFSQDKNEIRVIRTFQPEYFTSEGKFNLYGLTIVINESSKDFGEILIKEEFQEKLSIIPKNNENQHFNNAFLLTKGNLEPFNTVTSTFYIELQKRMTRLKLSSITIDFGENQDIQPMKIAGLNLDLKKYDKSLPKLLKKRCGLEIEFANIEKILLRDNLDVMPDNDGIQGVYGDRDEGALHFVSGDAQNFFDFLISWAKKEENVFINNREKFIELKNMLTAKYVGDFHSDTLIEKYYDTHFLGNPCLVYESRWKDNKDRFTGGPERWLHFYHLKKKKEITIRYSVQGLKDDTTTDNKIERELMSTVEKWLKTLKIL